MKVIHPKTKSTLIMTDGCPLIAEIESPSQDFPEYVAVCIGEVGASSGLMVYREDWEAFKQLVAEIDAEWVT